MTAIGELDAASTKGGEEPAAPAEGAVTKGAVGVGKRQTFQYAGNGEAGQAPRFKHDLGTGYVTIAAFSQHEAEPLAKENLANYDIASTTEVARTAAKIEKGTTLTIVLSA